MSGKYRKEIEREAYTSREIKLDNKNNSYYPEEVVNDVLCKIEWDLGYIIDKINNVDSLDSIDEVKNDLRYLKDKLY